MKHFFIDTNVLLDLVFGREPFVYEAEKLFNLAEGGTARLYTSSVSFKDVYYLVRKTRSHDATLQALFVFEELTTILGVSQHEIGDAMRSGFPDFEDAIQHACACSEKKISAIVTRDRKGFKKSTIPVLTPTEALAELG